MVKTHAAVCCTRMIRTEQYQSFHPPSATLQVSDLHLLLGLPRIFTVITEKGSA